jgi:predicted nucleic acid-binding protein
VSLFVDTSALMAVLDADDQNHPAAAGLWKELVTTETELVCTNYILLEAFALIQNRLGLEAVRTFHEDMMPLLQIAWIEAEEHARGVAALLTAGRRQLSLVDCISFETMRAAGINQTFSFDRHFAQQGFVCKP